MHTAREERRDRSQDRRATLLTERFSPDEREGCRERSGVTGIEIPFEAELPRIERMRVLPDAAAPILMP
jgi:hypothetical protein